MGRIRTKNLRKKNDKPIDQDTLLDEFIDEIEDQLYGDVITQSPEIKENDLRSVFKRHKKIMRNIRFNPDIVKEANTISGRALQLYLEAEERRVEGDAELNMKDFVKQAMEERDKQ
jgi:hypothetical protein